MNSPLPMFGSLTGVVAQVAPVSIHGDVYYDIALTVTPPPARPVTVRLPNHLCPRPPQTGDKVELSFLMQQVNGVKFI